MLRSLLRLSGAVAFALLIAPLAPSAAPAPGLAYDEIVRVVIAATPPPPGNFQTDLALALAPPPTPTATPAPRRHGLAGLGDIAGAVLNGPGAVAGAAANQAASNAAGDAAARSMGGAFPGLTASLGSFLQPHVMHYAYWNGWERVEDPVAQTATIRKCNLGQVIMLDLAHRTYSIVSPDAEPSSGPAPPPPPAPARHQQQQVDPAAPGTMVANLSETATALGPLRIDHTPTEGYSAVMTFSSTQATGSCRNGSASITTLEYLPAIGRPSVNMCPIRRAPVPQTASEAVTAPSGGCKPTFSMHRSGPTPPANRLAMYTLVSFSAGATPQPAASAAPAGFGFLTERGNLRTLTAADSGLFDVPQGFTKTP